MYPISSFLFSSFPSRYLSSLKLAFLHSDQVSLHDRALTLDDDSDIRANVSIVQRI